MTFHVPNKFRYRAPQLPGSTDDDGNNGLFFVPWQDARGNDVTLCAIATDGMDWEHVSVTVYKKNRCPTWDEMCFIKTLFWDDSDLVVQYHPPASEYVNNHAYCLHLWRKMGTNNFVEMPPSILVGVKT